SKEADPMPMPLGHTAIGLAALETAQPSNSRGARLGLFAYVTILANLPDLDILFGLLLTGNGAAFHRGPTHSLLFVALAGYLAARFSRWWQRGPQLSFALCALLIFSHMAADLFLTAAPVSLFWPLEVNWSLGFSGWGNVIQLVIFQSLQDFIIAAVVVVYIFILRQLRGGVSVSNTAWALAKRRIKSVR
ncbi:MAG: metal-dependent hydrolase, partial [Desulfatitalea sp.]